MTMVSGGKPFLVNVSITRRRCCRDAVHRVQRQATGLTQRYVASEPRTVPVHGTPKPPRILP